ncbi:MAG: hypothetical protein Q7T51_01810 [Candidatus Moranbacteria bacterium]|nr:hypothetical protein [Candidatus Moranbacteria bacterium]
MHERELQSKLEKVEVAYVKTVEKYGEYSDLRSFMEYVRTVEKLFIEDGFRKHSLDQSKHELIEIKIKLLAKNSSMSEDALNLMYDYFKKAGQSVDRIYAVTEELLGKNAGNPDRQDFILYVRDIFVNFLNAEKENIGVDELKNRLIEARMKVLASDGNPDLLSLEKIYSEFRELLNNN